MEKFVKELKKNYTAFWKFCRDWYVETTKGLVFRKGPHLLDILNIVLITGGSNCMNKCACVWSVQTSDQTKKLSTVQFYHEENVL